MPDLRVNRTLVKSPPELWSELSEVESLARHLGEFGEISISRLEPEHTVAWEGEHARGTVELEASGWGTKVTLSAAVPGAEPEPETPPEPEPAAPEPAAQAEEPADRRGSWLTRWLFRRRTTSPAPVAAEPGTEEFAPVSEETLAWYDPDPADPEPEQAEAASATAPGPGPDRAEAVLEGVLDTLGAAHHRPFSREG
jgi:hypothetical protein